MWLKLSKNGLWGHLEHGKLPDFQSPKSTQTENMTDPSDSLLRRLFWSFLLQPQLSQTDKKAEGKNHRSSRYNLTYSQEKQKGGKKKTSKQAKITDDGKTESHKTAWHFHSACLDWGLLCPCAVCRIYSTEPMLAAPLCAQVVSSPPPPASVATFLCFYFVFKWEELFVDLVWIFFFFSLPPFFWGGVLICSPGWPPTSDSPASDLRS